MLCEKESPFNEKYISNGIGDSYKQWKTSKKMHSSTNVFIESPTGTGKTSFIVNVLLPYAIERGRGLIYVCNRDALRKQTEQAIKESPLDLTVNYYDKEKISVFRTKKSIPLIAVVNYQSISALEGLVFNPYYIIFDEVHFFLEDALFNVITSKIYAYLMETYIHQVHVFMSATIGDFEEFYKETYREFLPDHPQPDIFEKYYHLYIEYYRNMYARPVYDIVLYRNEEYLLDRIQKTEGQKWLIFVSSKSDGDALKKVIIKQCERKCSFLKAQNKNNTVWKNLIDQSCFDKDILITTKVIDNGVNIKDSSVTNIVLPFSYPTEFIQMIGRKRFQNDSERVTVYVKQPKIQEITTKIRSFMNSLEFIGMIEQDHKLKNKQKIIKEYWRKPEYNNLFDFNFNNYKIDFDRNYLSIYKLYKLIGFYESLKYSHNNTQMHIDFLNLWLKNKIVNIRHELVPSNIHSLNEFLESNLNQRITDIEPFYQTFIELYNIYCYNIFMKEKKDEEIFKEALSIRKGSTQRKATINRSLRFLELPYQLYKKNNFWILCKLPQ